MAKNEVGKIRAKLVELYTRVIKPDEKQNNIYLNGEDNLYPYEIERFINNSPTATRATDIMQRFIAGEGVENDFIVNAKKGYYLSDIVDMAAEDVSEQNGTYVWIGYGFDPEVSQKPIPNKLDTLDYSNCRISKEDDNEYKGKIYLKDWNAKKGFGTRSSTNDKQWFYPYNPNPDVIIAQMKADARKGLGLKKDEPVSVEQMVKHYRGQVFYLNMTRKYKYALSKFDSVVNDADSEFRFSLFVNREMRTGFLGKVIAIIKGEDEDNTVEKDLGSLLGAENVGSLLAIRAEQTDEIDKVLKIEQLKAQIDDKMFVEQDKRIRRNILGAANNLPEPLIYAGEGALFGTSGETYREMKLFYQEQTQRERKAIERAFTMIGFPTKIVPLVEETITPTTDANTN